MFNSLFAEETGLTSAKAEEPKDGAQESGASTSASAANPLFGLWNVAAAVTNSVKARADELVKSVVDTDWRNELSTFSREVGEEGKTLKHKTAELVEHLPEQVVHLPEKAEEALTHLPASVHLPKEVGQTLGDVSTAFAEFGKSLFAGTRELLDELKEGVETEIAVATRETKRSTRSKTATTAAAKLSAVSTKYNRFEAEVAAMQRDSSTYCDEPEDAEDYARWRAGFSLDPAAVSRTTSDNAFMAELEGRLVPIIVEHADFWTRYFYRLHKLQQKEEQRQQLANRAKSLTQEAEEEELGWGDDDAETPAAAPVGESKAAEPPAEASNAAEPKKEAAAAASAGSGSGKAGGKDRAAKKAGKEAKEAAPAVAAAAAPAVAAATAAAGAEVAAPAPAAAATAVSGPAPIAAAAAGPTAAEAAAPAAEPEPAGASAGRVQVSAGGASGTGSSGSQPDGVELGLESEPHAETASDSSAREWCVVSPEHRAGGAAAGTSTGGASTGGASPAPPAAPEAEAAVAASREEEEEEQSGDDAAPWGDVGAGGEASGSAAAEAAPDAKDAVEAAGEPAADAAPKKGQRNAGGKEEEELDEDWGNWD